MDYIDKRTKRYSSKGAFYSTDEYKKLYPMLTQLHKMNRASASDKAKDAMKDVGVKVGDTVEYCVANPWHQVFEFEGTVKLDKYGVPYVKLAQKSIDGKSRMKWHKGFTKKKKGSSQCKRIYG